MRTLEEVIVALMFCVKLNYELWIICEYLNQYPQQEVLARRDVRRFHRRWTAAAAA